MKLKRAFRIAALYALTGSLWLYVCNLALSKLRALGVDMTYLNSLSEVLFLFLSSLLILGVLIYQDTKAARREQLLVSKELELSDKLREVDALNSRLTVRLEAAERSNANIVDLAAELDRKNALLADQVQRLEVVNNVGSAVHSIENISPLLDILVTLSADCMDAQIGYILVDSEEPGHLEVAAAIGLKREYSVGTLIPLVPGGVAAHVIDSNQPVRICKDSRPAWLRERSLLDFDFSEVLSVPLRAAGKVIGVLTLANRVDGSRFSEQDLSTLVTIVGQAGTAMTNVQVAKEREKVYIDIISSLVTVVEANDEYTRGHSDRVTEIALKTAGHLDFTPFALRELETAARLHDLGKVGVDVRILHKDGRLDDGEYAVMKQHPEIGKKILGPLNTMERVGDIISQHHEWFDGSGYPYCLAGRQIMLSARIIGVVDAYDAMTSDRPYRKGLPHDVAMQEIRDYSGTQFCPYVVEAFEKAVA